ncbi:MAG TPA: tetratricopeptide repeat protein [Anaerolineales bacterium]|nr:tetratricopeptide repeat protein [Anaerolineales bacterium]
MEDKLPEEIPFGEWLHRRRRLLDLTQQALADQVGCAHITLRRIESGTLKPSRELALILLEKLGVPQADREAWLPFARGLSGIPGAPTDSFAGKPITNLPIPLTSFVGREKERDEIRDLVAKHRLVTLTGPGGIGKTRLSIQSAGESLPQYPDGVWLVELAPVLDPLLVPRTAALAIGLREEPRRPVIDMLCDYLHDKKMLILLDNCEHLVQACAQMAERLLHACPEVCILASSREVLGVPGEVTYRVPSLDLPDVEHLHSIESLSKYEAVQLFIARARSAVPAFTVTEENTAALAQICHHLDGIPLAIELAAAKVRVLTLGQIAERLDDRFRLLTGGSRTALERHHTLQATIGWSYNLLSPAEQILFRRLAVFIGGWTIEAAELICAEAAGLVQYDTILDLLEQLINKSLVTVEEMQGKPGHVPRRSLRYRMLETIRQYGNERLVDSGESDTLRDRHLDYFLDWAELAAPHLIRPEQLDWLAELDTDYENLRLALKWALRKESPEPSLRLCAALGTFWRIRCYWMEGSKWLKSALAKKPTSPTAAEKVARVRALYQDAELAQNLDDLERMKSSAELSLALAREGPERRDTAIARLYVGNALRRRGEDEAARQRIMESLAEFQEIPDPYWEVVSYNILNSIRIRQDDLRRSEENSFMQAVEFARSAGERSNLAEALLNYSRWLLVFNRADEAQTCVEEADHYLEQIGSSLGSTYQLFAEVALWNDDYPEARWFYTEAQARFILLGEKNQRSSVLEDLGHLEMDQGNLAQAQTYLTEALQTAREIEKRASIAPRLVRLGITFFLQGKIEECKPYFQEAIPLAKGLRSFRKINILILIIHYLQVRETQDVANILGAIDHAQRENERPIDPLWKRYYDGILTRARDIFGEVQFQSAFMEGQKMSLDEALDLAFKIVEDI